MKTIRGECMHPHEGNSAVQILSSSGNSCIIQIENLRDADQASVRAAILREKQTKKAPASIPEPEMSAG